MSCSISANCIVDQGLLEIKMIVLTLLSLSTPALAGGEYEVVDPLNITSAPPVGRLLLHTLNEPSPA